MNYLLCIIGTLLIINIYLVFKLLNLLRAFLKASHVNALMVENFNKLYKVNNELLKKLFDK